MFNRLFLFSLVLTLMFSVPAICQDEEPMPEKTFTDTVSIYATPVLSQGSTGTCWSFSTTSFIESELYRMGKGEVDFSELFTVYKTYVDKAKLYVRMYGNSTFSQGAHLYDVVRVIEEYGAVPDSVYTGMLAGDERHNHSELSRTLKAFLDALLKSRRAPSEKWLNAHKGILDAYIGEPPATFEYKGEEHTPRSYADTYIDIKPEDYLLFMSFTDLPMWEQGMCYVPDNWMQNDSYWNLPLDDFIRVFDHALSNDYSVVIAADVSEEMFRQGEGYAVLERDLEADPELVTAEERQQMWDAWKTTDDHGMHAIGVATDQDGNTFYKVKNSWGTGEGTGPYKGYIYMGKNYMRAKLESFMVHKDALPADIREKLNIR